MKKMIGTALALGLACAANAVVIPAATDATYFYVSDTDLRVNNDVVRVGGNDGGTIEFIGLLGFDISGYAGDPADITSVTLGFDLGAQDNNPALDQIAIDYVGTFSSNDLGVNGVNGASANATTIANSPSLTSLFSGAETVGAGKSYDASGISIATLVNQYAFFLVTDPNGGTHQWDIPAGSATLTVIPEPATLGMVAVFGGGILFVRRRLML